jgi:hypothetical protein
MTKTELLENIRASRQKLVEVFEAVPIERRDEPGVTGDWSAKDILVHLTYWEGQLVTLLFQLRSGTAPNTLHFSGRNVDEINAAWRAQGRSRAWEAAWSDFSGLGTQLPRRVGQFSDEELNNPRLHARLRGRPLSDWIASDSYEHEDEHRAAIEAWLSRA